METDSPDPVVEDDPKPNYSRPAQAVGACWAILALGNVFTYWQDPLLLNLASAFRFQLWLVLVAMTLPAMLLFRGKPRVVFLGVPVAIGLTFFGYLFPSSVSDSDKSWAISVANIYSGNLDTSRLHQWVESQPCEVLGVLEVAPGHTESLKSMGFEHTVIEARSSNFGLALLSKTEPLKSMVLNPESPFPSIFAEFEDYQVVLTHPIPPISREARAVGDQQMIELSKVLVKAEVKKPTIIMGDFNATGWDLRVDPLRQAGLRDARKGFGMIPTWPVDKPWMGIPIDHIFVDQSFQVLDFARGPDVGSDHYPIRAVVGF